VEQVNRINDFVRTYWPLLIVLIGFAGLFARLDERLSTVVTNVANISNKLDSDVIIKNEFDIYKEGVDFRLRQLEAEVRDLQLREEVSNIR
jgi:hypothetical protein